MSLILSGDTGVPVTTVTGTLPVANGGTGVTTAIDYGFKNRIINGGMVIDQRNAGASVSTSGYAVDRTSFALGISTGSTGQQSSTAPAGFNTSLKITIGTGGTVVAGTVCRVFQTIEGFNVADLGWGSANASTITISFWVNCSVTGTFAGGLYNAAANRTYVFTYSVSAANTWEQKTITIAGDTSVTWAKDNTAVIYVNWDLGSGSTYQATAGSWGAGAAWATSGSVKLATTSGATFYITGVQLEKGSTATSFDYRPYGPELALCQRYYQQRGGNSADERFASGFNYQTTQARFIYPARVVMRTSPTLTVNSGTDFHIEGASGAFVSTSLSLDQPSPEIIAINCNVASGLTAGQGCQLQARSSSSRIMFSAEL